MFICLKIIINRKKFNRRIQMFIEQDSQTWLITKTHWEEERMCIAFLRRHENQWYYAKMQWSKTPIKLMFAHEQFKSITLETRNAVYKPLKFHWLTSGPDSQRWEFARARIHFRTVHARSRHVVTVITRWQPEIFYIFSALVHVIELESVGIRFCGNAINVKIF